MKQDSKDSTGAVEHIEGDVIQRTKLGQFAKGQSGNPRGRRRGESVLREIEFQLELTDSTGVTKCRRIVEKLFERALAGDHRFMAELLKRTAPERLALESDGIPLVIVRSYTGLDHERSLIDGTVVIEDVRERLPDVVQLPDEGGS